MGKTAKVGEHMSEEFVIIDYEDRYKPELLAISLPWLEENDILEPADLEQLEHPERVLGRTRTPILEPEEFYETDGYYNGCVFPTGNVVKGGILYVYYGGADRYCCAATADFDSLLEAVLKNE